MYISSSGYYATGSSAINDLLREYECNTTGIVGGKEYEHVLFYTPGGLFDLEDKLLKGNSIHRSDEAIKCYSKEMERLYRYNFGWFGSYKELLGEQFCYINKKFIDELIQFKVDAHWSYHIRRMGFSLRKGKYSLINCICGKKIRGKFWEGYFYDGNQEIVYSFPTEHEFNQNARQFVLDYFDCILGEDRMKNLILNHAVLPQHLERISGYGIDDFFVIVADRDPRDVYTYVKYVGEQRGVKSRIPTEINEFIKFWKRLRLKKKENSSRILNIRFEDLIYCYEETVNKIEVFLGLDRKEHVDIKKYFDPSISINNTQIYKMFNNHIDEIKLIERELHEYLYDFPLIELRTNIAIEDLGNIHLKER